MIGMIGLTALTMLQPPPSGQAGVQQDIAYSVVPGAASAPTRRFEALLREASGNFRLRQARLEPASLRSCGDRNSPAAVDLCARMALPPGSGGAPVVAFAIEEERRPNVTGSRVNRTYKLHCVGPRGVGTMPLPEQGELSGLAYRRMAEGDLRVCLRDALAVPSWLSLDERGNGRARAPYSVYQVRPVRSAAQVTRTFNDIAIIEYSAADIYKPADRRACLYPVRVVEVERGTAWRRGDMAEFTIGCGDLNRAAFRRWLPGGDGARGRARIYSSGSFIQHVEPVGGTGR